MNRSIRLTLLIALLLTFITAVSPQENANSKGGSITGRVMLASKGVAGVTVTITMQARVSETTLFVWHPTDSRDAAR
jgi:hypothetical protein